MKNNNKLTLKQLQQELESLKLKNKDSKTVDTNTNTIGHGIKESFIQRLYMKSSGFYLFLITGVLGYATKLPIIGKVLTGLALWYRKYRIIGILIKVRKIFVLFNALIGLLIVLGSIGFEPSLLIYNWLALGNTYIEIFYSLCKRLFNWLVELFDHKIVPNVPNNKPNNSFGIYKNNSSSPITDWFNDKKIPKSWNPFKDSTPSSELSLRKLYTQGGLNVNINTGYTPWYKDWTTYLWIAGGLITIGTIYLGIKFITDPLWVQDVLGTGADKGKGIPPADPGTSGPAIVISDIRSPNISPLAIGSKIKHYLSYLNPVNWIPSASEHKAQLDAFVNQQQSYNYDNRFYPYTNNNPFDSWIKKMRIAYLGESSAELLERNNLKGDILFDLTNIGGTLSPALSSVPASPNIGNLGLGLKNISGSAFMEQIEASTSYASVSEKLSSIPHTPTISPKFSHIELPVSTEIDEWVNNKPTGTANDAFVELQKWRIKYDKLPRGPSSVAGIKTSDNKYKYLDIE